MSDHRLQFIKLPVTIKRRYAIILISLFGFGVAFWYWLPSPLFDAPYSAVLYSNKGELLSAQVASDQQWRFNPSFGVPEQQNNPPALATPVVELSSKYLDALITFEDKRFFDHHGVDIGALMRALWRNFQSDHIVSGGSTITMQTIRLARHNPARTYFEKLKEILLALRLEFSFSKIEIIKLYAANAPFGGNVVGLDAASWKYFGRSPSQLSWAEAALLAVLPNAPSSLHLAKKRKQLQNKRDRLLNRLFKQGKLTALDLKLAIAEPLPTAHRPLPGLARYYLQSLQKKMNAASFYSTIDKALQHRLEQEVNFYQKTLTEKTIEHSAAIIVDNQSHAIVSYVGNSALFNTNKNAYALDLADRPRSSGSLLKPFLYAAMLEQGEITPTQLVPDLPVQFNGYSPQNYDRQFRGAVPAREALAQSLNIPAVGMLRIYGLDRFYHQLKQLGLTSLQRTADDYGLPLILGGAEVSLLEMTQSYANLARIGVGIEGNTNQFRKLRWLQTDKATTVGAHSISKGAAYLTLQALLEVKRPGIDNLWREFANGQGISWKTGTSFGLKDGWAIGATSRWTVGIWVGNADGRGVAGLTGAGTAAPLLFKIFRQLPRSEPVEMPFDDLIPVKTCTDDGYLDNGHCLATTSWLPRSSHYTKLSPYHQRVHLDKLNGLRVNSNCEKIRNIKSKDWFSLPPAMSYFYARSHSNYKSMPAYRSDCVVATNDKPPLSIIYPSANAKVYLPMDLNGELSSLIIKATHNTGNRTIYWHLDDQYLGYTKHFHQWSLNAEPGWHKLVLIDEQGNSVQQAFEILGR